MRSESQQVRSGVRPVVDFVREPWIRLLFFAHCVGAQKRTTQSINRRIHECA
jgi:hypothetical protein